MSHSEIGLCPVLEVGGVNLVLPHLHCGVDVDVSDFCFRGELIQGGLDMLVELSNIFPIYRGVGWFSLHGILMMSLIRFGDYIPS